MIKSHDTRINSQALINSYIVSLTGVFALHRPNVAKALREENFSIMTLKSSYPDEDFNLHFNAIIGELSEPDSSLKILVNQISSAFVASMWNTLKSHTRYDQIATEPDIQFFRHLRNACGHDGSWNFNELKYPACWRDKELLLFHSGSEVFGGLLAYGDVILLMQDIDKKYFEQ
jgi:hypothetical protein